MTEIDEEYIKALKKRLKKMGYSDEEIDEMLEAEHVEEGYI